ncbi:lysosomal acid glucosylceramidase [Culicoides brevitarsis]|uniref:lysosomal acid glucosylceramidase n=1 Tax=Culicoides brevitarsis TaxID=469753 RepID=UPI00307B71EE
MNLCKHFLRLVAVFGVVGVIFTVAASPCHLRPFKAGLVCVCNSTYCDTLEFNAPRKNGSFVLVSTSEQGLRFQKKEGIFATETVVVHDIKQKRRQRSSPNVIDSRSLIKWLMDRYTSNSQPTTRASDTVTVKIDHSIKYQRIVGFGGALTGSVAHLLNNMSPELRDKVLESYFSKDTGIGYSMVRTSIGGCDFDLKPWAYNELPEHDAKLSNFTELDARDLLKVKILEKINEIAKEEVKIMAAAWSPPKWMKTNNEWTGASALFSEYYGTWADYHIKFLELMKQQNVSVWAISTGNEPMNGAVFWMVVKFMSLGWAPKEQGIWVAKHLGPKLKEKFPNVLLFAGDDQRYTFPRWFNDMKEGNPDSMKYIDGLAVHWYWDMFIPPGSTIGKTKKLYPEKLIINTESCLGDKPWDHHGPVLGSWGRAMEYITPIMQDLRYNVNGWTDWNLILDEQGGPNYAKNYVEAPMVKNNTIDEIYKQPIFYVLGHFSRFIVPGSVRVQSTSSDKSLLVLAFERPDGLTSVILYNSHKLPVTVKLEDNKNRNQEFFLPPHSIHSLLYA